MKHRRCGDDSWSSWSLHADHVDSSGEATITMAILQPRAGAAQRSPRPTHDHTIRSGLPGLPHAGRDKRASPAKAKPITPSLLMSLMS